MHDHGHWLHDIAVKSLADNQNKGSDSPSSHKFLVKLLLEVFVFFGASAIATALTVYERKILIIEFRRVGEDAFCLTFGAHAFTGNVSILDSVDKTALSDASWANDKDTGAKLIHFGVNHRFLRVVFTFY